MRLRDYPTALRERWRIVAAGVLVGLLLGLAALWVTPPHYSSETTLYVATRSAEATTTQQYDATLLAYEKVRTYRAFLRSPMFIEAVAAEAGVDADAVRNGFIASVPPGTPIITVTTTGDSPDQATAIARGIGKQFLDLVVTLDPAGAPMVPQVIQPATYNPEPVSGGTLAYLTLGAGAGLLLGACLVVAAHVNDRSIRGPRALGDVAVAPVLGVIPADRSVRRLPLSLHADEDGPRAEAYRQVRTSLAFVTADPDPRTILIAGASPGEGRSTVVVELAIALGDVGRTVVVVDTDLRSGGAGTVLGLETTLGLSGVLSGQVTLDEVLQPWGRGRFDVVTSGRLPPHPTDLLGSPAFDRTLSELRTRYDVVLLDAPPAGSVADAGVLAARSDAVVLVARYGRTATDQLQAAVAAISASGTPVIGAVLVGMPRRGPLSATIASRSRRASPVRTLVTPGPPRQDAPAGPGEETLR